MGVDITLHLEIKQQEQWHRLSLSSPQITLEGDEDLDKPGVFTCRYYNFEPFITDASSHIYEDITVLSEEARIAIEQEEPDNNMGFGVFMFEDLNNYCENLIKSIQNDISQTALFALNERLGRIERLLLGAGKPEKTSTDYPDDEDICLASVEEIYNAYMNGSDGVVLEYWLSVRALPLIVPGLNPDSLRVFYEIW